MFHGSDCGISEAIDRHQLGVLRRNMPECNGTAHRLNLFCQPHQNVFIFPPSQPRPACERSRELSRISGSIIRGDWESVKKPGRDVSVPLRVMRHWVYGWWAKKEAET